VMCQEVFDAQTAFRPTPEKRSASFWRIRRWFMRCIHDKKQHDQFSL